MKNKNFFSILIPTKNRSDLLKNCLVSVLNQSFNDFEIIVCDNNSKDNTKLLVNNFKDKRLKYFRQSSDVPVTENWNSSFNYCNGNFIINIGDDDVLHKNFLAEIYKTIVQHDSEIVIVKHSRYYFNDYYERVLQGLFVKKLATNKVQKLNNDEIINRFCKFDKFFHSGALAIKKNIYDEIKYENKGNLYEEPFPDYIAIYKSILKSKNINYIDKILFIAGVTSRGNGNDAILNRNAYWNREAKLVLNKSTPISGLFFTNFYFISINKVLESSNSKFEINKYIYFKKLIEEIFNIKYTTKNDPSLSFIFSVFKKILFLKDISLTIRIYLIFSYQILKLFLKKIKINKLYKRGFIQENVRYLSINDALKTINNE